MLPEFERSGHSAREGAHQQHEQPRVPGPRLQALHPPKLLHVDVVVPLAGVGGLQGGRGGQGRVRCRPRSRKVQAFTRRQDDRSVCEPSDEYGARASDQPAQVLISSHASHSRLLVSRRRPPGQGAGMCTAAPAASMGAQVGRVQGQGRGQGQRFRGVRARSELHRRAVAALSGLLPGPLPTLLHNQAPVLHWDTAPCRLQRTVATGPSTRSGCWRTRPRRRRQRVIAPGQSAAAGRGRRAERRWLVWRGEAGFTQVRSPAASPAPWR
jgi:hypothetical protein